MPTSSLVPDPQPFFTNDMWGLLKTLLVVVGPVVAGVLAGIWKMMRGPLQEADRQLREEVRRVDDALRRDLRAAIGEARGEHAAALNAAVQRQAERDSRMAQRVTRVETLLEVSEQH